MLIDDYRFECRFLSQALLPAFKGSTLRGALGHALKKIACALRRNSCDSCLLTGTCPYAFLFETEKIDRRATAANTRLSGRPHPYVLVPPVDHSRHYNIGDSFSFALKLFGKANDFLPHLIYGIELMGQEGLGRKQDTNPGLFSLAKVFQDGQKIYDGDSRILQPIPQHPDLLLTDQPAVPVDDLTVQLKTPLRLKQKNHLQGEALPFQTLIRAALRRISSLENFYGNGEPPLDYKGLTHRAGLVKTMNNNCRWIEFERYSSRQKTTMMIGGLSGIVQYAGELTEFLPVLRYCEQTHLGKQTSFGLGQIQISAGDG
ncbi:MAG: hypothetical protein A2511_10815 [Deltaproteobacteria bacterium RIFOXYD12_FULL_50_9]|nr:MAG: hypothetical protein A2511_10815 [Deltaproteobacteria bacterium RIFOXYD12_FULL_50_9]